MADRAIGELDEALSINSTDLLVMEQDGAAKKVKGQTLENWLLKMANSHGGIQSIVLSGSSGLKDTYRITLSDGTTFDFVVTNGKSISKISKTATSGLVDTYTVSYNDNSQSTFTVTNGAKGDKGDSTFVWIRYASQKPTEASHSFGTIPDNWMGIYTGPSATAPTNWTQYSWFQIKGATGATGAAAALVSSTVEYQASEYGNVAPSGSWSSSVPNVPQGRYLWTRTTHQFNSGNPVITYTVSRMGMDGLGSVSSVCGVSPDDTGNVPLTADLLGALPVVGGQMQGTLNMADQKLTGLRTPEVDTDAAPKSFVDKSVEDKADYVKAVQGEAITLSDSAEAPLQGLKVYGKTTQNGIPKPQAPVSLDNVGESGSVNVNVIGKNLLNQHSSNWQSEEITNGITYTYVRDSDGNLLYINAKGTSTATSNSHAKKAFTTLPAGTYTVTGCPSGYGGDISLRVGKGPSGEYMDVDQGNGCTFTLTEETVISINPMVGAGKAVSNVKLYPMIRLASVNNDAYEPYKWQNLSVSTPGGLPGIHVTSGGNYIDPVTGKRWICDEVDFEKGVYIQRVRMVSVSQTTSTSDNLMILPDTAGAKRPLSIISNYTDWAKFGLTDSGENIFIRGSANASANKVNLTHAELNALLTETPMVLIYALAEENHIPLSEIDPDALAQYATLHTNYPNTTISNDAGAGMEAKYATPNSAIPASGGKFGGQVNMCNNKLTGIPSPEDPSDAVPLSYAAQILEMGMEYTDDALKNIRSVPESGAGDNGKILTVVNGVPTWITIETWSGGSY